MGEALGLVRRQQPGHHCLCFVLSRSKPTVPSASRPHDVSPIRKRIIYTTELCVVLNRAQLKGAASGGQSARGPFLRVLAVLLAHPAVASVQADGLLAVAKSPVGVWAAPAVTHLALRAAVGAMCAHGSDARIQRLGCDAIQRTIMRSGLRGSTWESLAGELVGAVAAVSAAMSACATDAQLAATGCRALAALLHALHDKQSGETAAEAALAAIRAFGGDALVVESALATLARAVEYLEGDC